MISLLALVVATIAPLAPLVPLKPFAPLVPTKPLAQSAPLAVESVRVRVQARPELPWVVAVAARDIDVSRADLEKALLSSRAALDDVGASAQVELIAGHAVVVAQGPPEAHDVVVSAAITAISPPIASTASSPNTAKAPRVVLFIDGRTSLTNKGPLPSRSLSSPSFSRVSSRGIALPLAPSPGLFDLEGEALALLVEKALDVDADVRASDGRVALVIEGAMPELDKARAALEAAVASPMSARVLDDLRTRARGRLAERRARAGGWARDMATMWLAVGTIDVEEPADLGSTLRARIFPNVLAR